MGLFKKPTAPAPMNVGAVTQQAGAQNTDNAQEQAAFNRPNQTNQHDGSLEWETAGTDANGNPIFRQTQRLGAVGQQFAGGFADLGQQYINSASAFQGNRPDMSPDAAMQKANEFWDSYEQPLQDRQTEANRTRLANMGHDASNASDPNSAYAADMSQLARQQAEAKARFSMNNVGQFQNMMLADRNQEMGELNTLQPGVQYGGQTITGGFANVPGVNVANVDVAGLNQQNQNDLWKKYQSDMQGYNAGIGGLASIGGTILGGPIGGYLAKNYLPGSSGSGGGSGK
jgi:hypothetical protein